MTGARGDCRNNGHRCCAATDDRYALAGIIEIFRPVLRMDESSAKDIGAGKFRRVAFGIIVIAGAAEKEVAGKGNRLALAAVLRFDSPQCFRG